jgi:CubicO group peptidase (beta-lactamase class C family)
MSLADELEAFLGRGVAGGIFPAAVARIEERGRLLAEVAVGEVSPGRPAVPETVFDLASLTKPLASTPLLLRRIGGPVPGLDTPLGELVPELLGTILERSPLSRLLDHTSGFQPWFPFYVRGKGRRSLDRTLRQLAASARPPGRGVVYSDPGFLLLGRIVEEAGADRLDRLFAREIAAPLGLARTLFRPPASWRSGIPATEPGDRTERRMVAERGLSWRGFLRGAPRGIAGDVNARSLGGVAGHAGLFGTAADVCRVVRLFLGEFPSVLSPDLASQAIRDRTRDLGPGRGLGWQTGRGAAPVEGVLGNASFGHVGFTGTSIWCDPRRRRIAVLLTNRVASAAPSIDFQQVRREFHRIAFLPSRRSDSVAASC